MSRGRIFIVKLMTVLTILVTASQASFAVDSDSKLSGLVINQTQSYVAQSFYQAFCLVWHEQQGASQFNVTLEESHSARNGRQVKVLFNNRVAYIASLPSGKLQINEIASAAASYSIQQVKALSLQKVTQSDPDLATDEI